ncbi:hypothetical protein F2P81_026101 [Scophthalmus maximus]|uniref:Uncharacterized protein n=1 Tax=Scophthalmus maximus TaxID=52904 RepID=A0A6A4RGN0_SCOMX|nr:hypothetical protein F2P81_026101 [Scophthalmus maximus]
MMFNISIDGGPFSKNLEDFDSIRSVLLYRVRSLLEYRRGFKNLVQGESSAHLGVGRAEADGAERDTDNDRESTSASNNSSDYSE